MKRRQRKLHFVLWLILTPALLYGLWQALSARTNEPVNATLPTAITEGRN
ncbi:MAG: hypothetical protein AAGJ86_01710 [Pseudomonadota bacterium]